MIITFNVGIKAPQYNIETVEKFNTRFITFNDIRQKIRVADSNTSIAPRTIIDTPQKNADYNASVITMFDAVNWANSNINMNPCLYPATNGEDSVICYITLGNNYKLLNYTTGYEILQTYHMNEKYNGCVIVVNKTQLEEICEKRYNLISLFVYDKTQKRISKINCTIKYKSDSEEYEPRIEGMPVPKDKYQTLKALNKKYTNDMKFKISSKRLLTATYICDSSKYDEVKAMTEKIKNASIIAIPDCLSDEEKKEIISQSLSEKIRAFTLVGVRVPFSILKELRMIYVFSYDTEKKIIRCIKSN